MKRGIRTVAISDVARGRLPRHLITAHRAFIERRRQLRPLEEDRIADADEWAEFEQHFLLRRVALGECASPLRDAVRPSTPAPDAGSCALIRRSLAASTR